MGECIDRIVGEHLYKLTSLQLVPYSPFGYADSVSGEFVTCRLFGNILCFSQLFYARATHTEKQVDLFDALARSYEYFGGVPATTVFDNAKAQVVRAD